MTKQLLLRSHHQHPPAPLVITNRFHHQHLMSAIDEASEVSLSLLSVSDFVSLLCETMTLMDDDDFYPILHLSLPSLS